MSRMAKRAPPMPVRSGIKRGIMQKEAQENTFTVSGNVGGKVSIKPSKGSDDYYLCFKLYNHYWRSLPNEDGTKHLSANQFFVSVRGQRDVLLEAASHLVADSEVTIYDAKVGSPSYEDVKRPLPLVMCDIADLEYAGGTQEHTHS